MLEQVQRLTPEEQMRLREFLAAPTTDHARSLRGSGAALVTFLRVMGPIAPAALDAMERASQDGCEEIDLRDW